ncbi:hypothetical protein M758_1G070800 [Ceratodon purpureus]|nr:hypothetical protein M758_1G070800 [Ceratodon purpureus]
MIHLSFSSCLWLESHLRVCMCSLCVCVRASICSRFCQDSSYCCVHRLITTISGVVGVS